MDGSIGDAYAELISRERWDWFLTLTFRPKSELQTGGVHPERADKAFRVLVSMMNRQIFGVRWYRSLETQIVWVRGQEFHKSGRIHFHAMFAGPDRDLDRSYRRMSVVDWWWREFGIARVERPTSQHDVSGYVAKYAAKDGEVDFSPNFGKVAVQPLDLFFSGCAPPGRKERAETESPCARVGSWFREVERDSRCLTLPVRFFSGADRPTDEAASWPAASELEPALG